MAGGRRISQRPGKFGARRGERGAGKDQRTSRRGFVLTVVAGANLGKEHFFESGATIGRVERNNIVLVEPGISRTHARILEEQGLFFVEDLKSANGTRLNGECLIWSIWVRTRSALQASCRRSSP